MTRVIVTRVDDRRQALALLALAPGAGTAAEWMALLNDLAIDEAILLPGTLETGDSLTRFRVAPRLTAHVRHRLKYADVPVGLEQEFVFTRGGRPTGRRARTVRDLLSALPALPDEIHAQRSDQEPVCVVRIVRPGLRETDEHPAIQREQAESGHDEGSAVQPRRPGGRADTVE